jgi:hypothetical protein
MVEIIQHTFNLLTAECFLAYWLRNLRMIIQILPNACKKMAQYVQFITDCVIRKNKKNCVSCQNIPRNEYATVCTSPGYPVFNGHICINIYEKNQLDTSTIYCTLNVCLWHHIPTVCTWCCTSWVVPISSYRLTGTQITTLLLNTDSCIKIHHRYSVSIRNAQLSKDSAISYAIVRYKNLVLDGTNCTIMLYVRMRMILSTSVWYRLDRTSLISDISDADQNIMVQFKTTRGDSWLRPILLHIMKWCGNTLLEILH